MRGSFLNTVTVINLIHCIVVINLSVHCNFLNTVTNQIHFVIVDFIVINFLILDNFSIIVIINILQVSIIAVIMCGDSGCTIVIGILNFLILI